GCRAFATAAPCRRSKPASPKPRLPSAPTLQALGGATSACGLFLHLDHLGLDAVALEGREVFHKHFAQQVIHLVLNANRQQAFCLNFTAVAVFIQGPDLDGRRALYAVINAGYGQAALFTHLLFLAGPEDFWVDQ